ncbi:MAG: hypothetical protein HYV14_13900 [Elusimicrobia bacterium]|nr:hypothetical protein [Elusimicrobiota bacterium]
MKSLSLIVLAVVSFGAMALSGCSGCMPAEEAKQTAAPPVTCGPGTVAQGTQCVGKVK